MKGEVHQESPPWWQPVALAGLAGGLGWGIRGQYGHETGAMIAGLLVSLILVHLFCPRASVLSAGRAVAWCTVAIGFGGSMTYGQTIGLTQDTPLVGNWEAWRWGMLGLAIKGGIWIGFAGVFLGMGLGGIRHRPLELLLLMIGLLALFFVGCWWLNEPFNPAQRVLPKIYFSDDWRWEPGQKLTPRREVWGGLLLALAAVLAYARVWKKDGLAWRLGLWGILGGAVGFPLGQCLQSFHAWNLELFRTGWWAQSDSVINWWNMMETTFGAVMGAALGLGLWLNRQRVAVAEEPPRTSIAPWLEWVLVVTYIPLLVMGEFMSVPQLAPLTDLGLAMGVLPVVAIAGGRWWPFLLAFPMTVLPIAGKTIRQLCDKEQAIPEWAGWLVYGALPIAVMATAAWWFVQGSDRRGGALFFTRPGLVLCAWIYFGLNFAFFHYPWVWQAWTVRTPNAILYTLCAIGLTWGALRVRRA